MWNLYLNDTSEVSIPNLVLKMQEELQNIRQILRSTPPVFLAFPTINRTTDFLKAVHDRVPTIKNQKHKQAILSLLRLHIFLIERHQNKMWPFASEIALAALAGEIQLISSDMSVGKVPQLRSRVVWADPEFLPPEIDGDTRTRWRQQLCPNPIRGPSVSRNEIHFIGVPREALEDEHLQDDIEYIDINGETLHLNLIDFEYYQLGLLHADHLLASANLIHRIKEMIAAMNLDPGFANEMRRSILNDGYFAEDAQHNIVGTYWLYMAYHNSIENLWLLLASDNAGAGKGAADPIAWLKKSEIGDRYLNYLVTAGKMIDTSDILYRVRDIHGRASVSLKESFITWAKASHSSLIHTYQAAAEYHQELRSVIAASSTDRKALIATELNISAAKLNVDPFRFFEGSQVGSVNTGSTASVIHNVTEAMKEDEELRDIHAAERIRVQELLEQELKERDSRKAEFGERAMKRPKYS